MASHTLTQPPSSASSREVKNSGLLRWLFGRRAENEPTEQFAELLDERLNSQSRHLMSAVRAELLAVVKALSEQQRVAGSPIDLDGSLPAYQLRHIAMLALDGELRPEMTWRGAVELLQDAWDQLNARADEQDAFERHTPLNKAEAGADGALLFASGRRGKPIGPDSERGKVAVAEVVDRALKAPMPTQQLPRVTDDMQDPRETDAAPALALVEVTQVLAHPHPWDAGNGTDGMVRSDGSRPSSPVHRDQIAAAPPIPDNGAPPDERSPLPRRHKIVSFPARMSATPGVPLDGEQRDAMDLAVMPGAFLLVDNTWRLVSTVAMDAALESVTAHLADGGDPSFEREEQVWLLPVEAAAPLAAAHRAELNEMESAR